MQCQLLFVEMFSLAEVFSCAFSVSFGRMCGVFNLRDALPLGKSLEAPGICWDHPSFLAAAFLSRNLPGLVGAGAVGAEALPPHGMWVVQGVRFLKQPQGAGNGLKGMFQGALFIFRCCGKSALTLW